MSLCKQEQTFFDIKLNYYSFVHPVNKKLWITCMDFAKSLKNFNNPTDTVDYILKGVDSMVTTWDNLVQLSHTTNRNYPIDYSSMPNNWDIKTVMIDESAVEMLILASDVKRAVDLKFWITKFVFPQIKKRGPYGTSVEFSKESTLVPAAPLSMSSGTGPKTPNKRRDCCPHCCKVRDEFKFKICELEMRLLEKKLQLEKYQKLIDFMSTAQNNVIKSLKRVSDTEIFI